MPENPDDPSCISEKLTNPEGPISAPSSKGSATLTCLGTTVFAVAGWTWHVPAGARARVAALPVMPHSGVPCDTALSGIMAFGDVVIGSLWGCPWDVGTSFQPGDGAFGTHLGRGGLPGDGVQLPGWGEPLRMEEAPGEAVSPGGRWPELRSAG